MIYIDIGRREQGKTTLAWFMVRQLPIRLVFDPRGMFGGEGRCVTRQELTRAYAAIDAGKADQLIFTPDEEAQEGFEAFVRVARKAVKEHDTIGILIDEAAFVDTERTTDLQWILRCASRQRVHIVLTAHRPSDVSTKVRAIADHWLLFHMRQEHDIRVVNERCGDAVVRAVQGLKAREFVNWNDTTGTYTVHKQPDRWFVALATAQEPSASDLLLETVGEKDVDNGLPLE